MSLEKKMLYVQYANPAAYPPIEYSSALLAEKGWSVRLLGVSSLGSEDFKLPEIPGRCVELMPYRKPGVIQKFQYFGFVTKCIWRAVRYRPDWIYVSDTMATPAGWILKKLGYRVLYHEHDAPQGRGDTVFIRWILSMRQSLARIADLIVIPQMERARHFREETGTDCPIKVVWNCPMSGDVYQHEIKARREGEPLRVYFHGSVNLNMVPLSLIEGAKLAGLPIVLRVVGYETIGSQGATDTLRQAAADSNVQLETPGAFPRHELAALMKNAHVGWIACCQPDNDFNLRHLAGASNKAFDYMAAGLALLVRADDGWQEFYEKPGYARSCEPESIESIAAALKWFYEHPEETAMMARNGRQRILDEWNYETHFETVHGSLEPFAIRP